MKPRRQFDEVLLFQKKQYIPACHVFGITIGLVPLPSVAYLAGDIFAAFMKILFYFFPDEKNIAIGNFTSPDSPCFPHRLFYTIKRKRTPVFFYFFWFFTKVGWKRFFRKQMKPSERLIYYQIKININFFFIFTLKIHKPLTLFARGLFSRLYSLKLHQHYTKTEYQGQEKSSLHLKSEFFLRMTHPEFFCGVSLVKLCSLVALNRPFSLN